MSLTIVFTLTDGADPDEMLHFATVTFHLGLHCLPKQFLKKSFQYITGKP